MQHEYWPQGESSHVGVLLAHLAVFCLIVVVTVGILLKWNIAALLLLVAILVAINVFTVIRPTGPQQFTSLGNQAQMQMESRRLGKRLASTAISLAEQCYVVGILALLNSRILSESQQHGLLGWWFLVAGVTAVAAVVTLICLVVRAMKYGRHRNEFYPL